MTTPCAYPTPAIFGTPPHRTHLPHWLGHFMLQVDSVATRMSRTKRMRFHELLRSSQQRPAATQKPAESHSLSMELGCFMHHACNLPHKISLLCSSKILLCSMQYLPRNEGCPTYSCTDQQEKGMRVRIPNTRRLNDTRQYTRYSE